MADGKKAPKRKRKSPLTNPKSIKWEEVKDPTYDGASK